MSNTNTFLSKQDRPWSDYFFMRRSRKFFQRGPTLRVFYLLFFSWYHYKRAIIVPQAKPYLNGVSLVGQWWPITECWLGSFVVLQGIQTSIDKRPYIFVIFQGGGGVRTHYPPLDPHMFFWSTSMLFVKAFLTSNYGVWNFRTSTIEEMEHKQ